MDKLVDSMKYLFKFVVALITLCCFAGCTTMRAANDVSPASIQAQLHEGDEVTITTKSGSVYNLTVTAIKRDALIGSADRHAVKVAYDQIATLKVRKFSAGKTAGLGAGIVAGLYVIAINDPHRFERCGSLMAC